MLNVFHGMCAYKCTVHECMYVLCTRFHFHNNATVLYVCVLCVCAVCVCAVCVCAVHVCVTNIWCTGYVHNNVCAHVHFVKTV